MTRQEHLAWAKERALEYLDQGNPAGALASMVSDLRKHLELQDHPGIPVGFMTMLCDGLNTDDAVRHWIEGFN
jgi:hypothetical protein